MRTKGERRVHCLLILLCLSRACKHGSPTKARCYWRSLQLLLRLNCSGWLCRHIHQEYDVLQRVEPREMPRRSQSIGKMGKRGHWTWALHMKICRWGRCLVNWATAKSPSSIMIQGLPLTVLKKFSFQMSLSFRCFASFALSKTTLIIVDDTVMACSSALNISSGSRCQHHLGQ